jgi:hypothetical protein
MNYTAEVYESSSIKADDNWPTYLGSYKRTSYSVPGLWSKESYYNNWDVVATSGTSWMLSKTRL